MEDREVCVLESGKGLLPQNVRVIVYTLTKLSVCCTDGRNPEKPGPGPDSSSLKCRDRRPGGPVIIGNGNQNSGVLEKGREDGPGHELLIADQNRCTFAGNSDHRWGGQIE